MTHIMKNRPLKISKLHTKMEGTLFFSRVEGINVKKSKNVKKEAHTASAAYKRWIETIKKPPFFSKKKEKKILISTKFRGTGEFGK